jgi:VWFA-related protein
LVHGRFGFQPSERYLAALRTLLALAVAFCAASICATAQDAPPQKTNFPALQVQAREVVLDIVVADKMGKVVTNLNKDAFRVYEDTVEQKIVSFSKPSDHQPIAGAPPVHSAADLVHAGNIPVNIIILDELNTAYEDTSYGRYSIEKYLKSQPAILTQPSTLLAISDSGLKMIHDYTQDRDDLINAVHSHFPVYPFRMTKGGSSGPDASERLARCLGTMLQIAQSVSGYKGRKSIIWVGKGFPSLDTDQVNQKIADEVNDASRMVTAALLNSRTVLNIIDPTPLSVSTVDFGDPDMISPNMLNDATNANGTEFLPGDINFADYAPATGGLAFFARNDVDREIGTAISDGAEYYTISYSPTNKSDDAVVLRKILVKLADPSLTAWTRTGYYRAKITAPDKAPPPPVHQLAFDMMNAAVSAVAYNALQVSAKRKGDTYTVSVQPVGLEYRSTPAGSTLAEVTVMHACFGPKAKVLEHNVEEVTRKVDAQHGVLTFDVNIDAPRGTARVRLVIRDAVSGKIGTVDVTP